MALVLQRIPGRYSKTDASRRAPSKFAAAWPGCSRAHGMAAVCEVSLANGRRADVAGRLGAAAKSGSWRSSPSIEDFRSDQKWPEYREFCDRLLFAVSPEFPSEILPADTGLIIADRYGGEIVRGRRPSTSLPERAARP